jgi:hypothetical protein
MPLAAYRHRADLPSDHHSDQYASSGGVLTQGSCAGTPSIRQRKPGTRCT